MDPHNRIKQVKIYLEECLDELSRGELSDRKLRQAIKDLESFENFDQGVFGRQDLLYLQASSTSLTSQVLGMLVVEDGVVSEGPADPKDWPYKSVLDAVKDGWRVIQFPNLALMMDESRTYGLGCEFILEKWRR